MNDKLDSQCTAFDFIYENNKPLVVEISFGFNPPIIIVLAIGRKV